MSNYGQLKTDVVAELHRNDIADRVPGFVDRARLRINRRFGQEYPQLVNETDTNESLQQNYEMWLYAATREGFLWAHNGNAAETYDARYVSEADLVNITGTSDDEPLQITRGY